ncbi:hypothetical protein QYF36_022391 [Acer negundo]|nr:hypothetical protein QYF36_022391 [Acer negundo]
MESYICQIHDQAWMAVEDGYTSPMMTPTGGGKDVLKPMVSHEGTEVVKGSKLQILQNQFEMLRMEEDECFNDFEIKLMDIVHQSHQLGDPYSDRRTKQKIIRSFPERFKSKVMALEENSGYKDMKPSEVIGILLAYESRKGPISTPPKKQKGISLKASKSEKEEKDDSDEDMALLMRRFKKFVKTEKKGFGSKGQDIKKKTHFKSEEEDECQEEIDSSDDSSSSQSINGNVDGMDLQDYIVKFESSRLKNKREIRRLKEENLELSTQVDHLSEQVMRSKKNENKLRDELAMYMRNEEGLKRELEEAKGSMTRMASSTKKLDHMLAVGKSPCDKRGLGFVNGKEISTLNKTMFVKSLSYKEASPIQTPEKKIDL